MAEPEIVAVGASDYEIRLHPDRQSIALIFGVDLRQQLRLGYSLTILEARALASKLLSMAALAEGPPAPDTPRH